MQESNSGAELSTKEGLSPLPKLSLIKQPLSEIEKSEIIKRRGKAKRLTKLRTVPDK